MKDELKEIIATRASFVLKDCRTFVASKTMSPKTVKLHRKAEVGGGNLLAAIGLVCLLELLARIYWMAEKCSDAQLTALVKKKDLDFISAVDAVGFLIAEIEKEGITLGLPGDESTIRSVWNRYRNELTHYVWIQKGAVTSMPVSYVPKHTLKEIEVEWSNQTAFVHAFEPDGSHNGRYLMSVDTFRLTMPQIVDWLVEHMTSLPEEKCAAIVHAVSLDYIVE